jgi:hypothetical protein
LRGWGEKVWRLWSDENCDGEAKAPVINSHEVFGGKEALKA